MASFSAGGPGRLVQMHLFHNVSFPHFPLFYFNKRLEFCKCFEWKIKRINDADLFSQPPLLIFIKGANISGWHCIYYYSLYLIYSSFFFFLSILFSLYYYAHVLSFVMLLSYSVQTTNANSAAQIHEQIWVKWLKYCKWRSTEAKIYCIYYSECWTLLPEMPEIS